ncbi:hypothetical protein PW5551_01555 [Petrotoga sp. 9PW.55.5.1]|uniref:hypothetical protein n=1 Tax=Petrotoga sp. 9PW.55.5.1 TaxID=1308979 RepID=UPI000DC5F4F6|nr:hypothetical protein [Petrotoga sp. 9PW.55.5.1]RAO99745.1 hypothetical protein PW5551_01555 [Petrotoga sp. 9PW.55.5.1]
MKEVFNIFININYPVSLETIRKLKNGDKVSYTGKIILVSPDALKRLSKYYTLEGVPLFNFLGEFVTSGTLNLAHGEIKSIDISEISDYFDFLFKGGANSLIIDKISPKTHNQLKNYKRPFFKSLSQTIGIYDPKVLLYKDIKNGGIIEVWTKNHPLEVLTFEEKEQMSDIDNAKL